MRLLATAGLLAVAATAAHAHGLLVFARVDGNDVVAEAKFSNGNPVRVGVFNVFDGDDRLLTSIEVGPDGVARFPLQGAETGLRIEMDAGDGHYDYWILTPADIAAQRAPQG
jgi:nickel transport protein